MSQKKSMILVSPLFLVVPFALLMLQGCQAEKQGGLSNSEIEQKVQDLLSNMTLEEKVGQMTQVDRRYLKESDDIKEYYLGSLLSGGGSTPEDNNPNSWADMYDTYQSVALETRLGIPLIYGIDAVHGHGNVKGAVVFPHNIGMGCTRNTKLVKQAAEITAREVAGTGIDWTFGPCVAVPQNERWGRTYEGFGESPEVVEMTAKATVEGFQGDDLGSSATILACAKHFIGDGGTTNGIDQGDTQVDEQILRDIHLPGYLGALKAGVGSIMVSFNSWNGEKCHGNKYLLTTLLKEELGFDGILVSDWAGINQLTGDYKSDIETGINAGLDMIMVPEHYESFIQNLKTLVEEEKVSMSRIDDAVSRILGIKYRLGLFDNPFADRSLTGLIGSSEHREIARECVRQSIVLLKNAKELLPLSKSLNRIHVAGKSADDIGNQCGGWTISWQGQSGEVTDGTTILEAIRQSVSSETQVTYSADGTGAEGADAAIAVVGEVPYAEFEGDRENLGLDQRDLSTIDNLKGVGIPVVVILITGRPLIIESELAKWDALLVAWLPGTEGQGVADVIFGDYSPTGKLSHSWPRTMDQIPINVGDADYNPLFEYRFGLSY